MASNIEALQAARMDDSEYQNTLRRFFGQNDIRTVFVPTNPWVNRTPQAAKLRVLRQHHERIAQVAYESNGLNAAELLDSIEIGLEEIGVRFVRQPDPTHGRSRAP